MIKSFSEAIDEISRISPGIVAKLRITPDEAGADRIASFYSTLAYVEKIKSEGADVLKIEAEVEDGYPVEADLVVRFKGDENISYLDLTTSESDDIFKAKLDKASKISLKHGINYSALRIPRSEVKVDYNLDIKASQSDAFKILDRTIDDPVDDWRCAEIADELIMKIIQSVSKEERLTLDKRWSSVPSLYISDNSSSSVKSALTHAMDITEIRAFIEKLSSAAAISSRKVLPISPSSSDDDPPHPTISALLKIPEDTSTYIITTDFTIEQYDQSMSKDMSFDERTIMVVKRKFNKSTNSIIKNRFKIKFNPIHHDETWIRAVTRSLNKAKLVSEGSRMLPDLPKADVESLWQSLYEYSDLCNILTEKVKDHNFNVADIYIKMISVIASELQADYILEDTSAFQIRSSLSTAIKSICDTVAAGVISHIYEVAKTVAAANSFSSRKDEYHLGKNGHFNSWTLVKCTGTQDSATMSPAMTYYKPADMKLSQSKFVSGSMVTGSYVCTNERTFTKNQLVWYLKLPYTFVNLVTWHMEQISTNLTAMSEVQADVLSSSAIFSLINRDAFAQVASLTRYWYGSSSGDYADLIGLLKKYDTYVPKTFTEIVYIARQVKMAACIRSAVVTGEYRGFCMGRVNSSILCKDSQGSVAFKVAMPHLEKSVSENSAIVSMFYISNIFNKYKHGVSSAAICFLGLHEELKIFNEAKAALVTGISQMNIAMPSFNAIANNTASYKHELDYIVECMYSGQDRYNCSLFATYIFSKVHRPIYDESKLFKRLKQAPIDAVTLRGGMESGDITVKQQSIRAASTMIEGILNSYGEDTTTFNDSSYAKYAVIDRLKDVDISLLSLKCRQYNKHKQYNYRVVHKDQTGHREISVLNYDMRIGTMFIETVFKFLYKNDDTDMLQNSDKFRIVQDYSRRVIESKDSYFFDNADQSRWGPNTMMHHLASMAIAQLTGVKGIARLCLDSLCEMTNKNAKIPDVLLDKVNKGQTVFSNLSVMGKAMSIISGMVQRKQYSLPMVCGMGQGILHETSSVLHTVDKKTIKSIMSKVVPQCVTQSFVTSDDDYSSVATPKNTVAELPFDPEEDPETSDVKTVLSSSNKISIISLYVHVQKRVNKLFNILRNRTKSFISRVISDFNSSFQFNLALAVPNLKQKISFIDCGSGEDLFSDLVSASASGAQYIASGGSYIGAFMLTATNYTLVLEQHRAWYKYKDSHKKMSCESVFSVGIPVIEPLSALLYGPISSVVLREMLVTKLPAKIILKALFTNLTASAEIIDQEQLVRGNSNKPKEKIRFLMPANISGVISMSRPTKAQSRFLKRHHLDSVIFPDELVHYSKHYPSLPNLLFSASIGVGSKSYDTSLGVNNFAIRFTESWINVNSTKFKRSSSAFAELLYEDQNYSIASFNKEASSLTVSKVIDSYLKLASKDTTDMPHILTESMSELMTPSYNFLIKMSTDEYRYSAHPEGSVFSHVTAALPHRVIGSKSDERRSLVAALYSGENKSFFLNMNKVSFGVKTDALLAAAKVPSLKDAIITADLIYNSIMKFIKVKTVAIARTSSSHVKYSDAIDVFYSENFSTLFKCEFRMDLTKLVAPISYISLNRTVHDKIISNRDSLTIAVSDNVLYNKPINPSKVFISSETDTVETANSILDFVDYETNRRFKLTSEAVKDFNYELLALYGFSGEVVMTSKFARALFSGITGSTTVEEYNGSLIKFIKFPKECLYCREDTPFGIVSVKSGKDYSIKLIFYVTSETKAVNLFAGVPMLTAPAWQKRLTSSLSRTWRNKDRLTMPKSAALPEEDIECIFITEQTTFKLEIHNDRPSFFLKRTTTPMVFPLKTNVELNRVSLSTAFRAYELPEYKDEDIAIDVAKALSTFVTNVMGVGKTDEIISKLNSINYPADRADMHKLANEVFQSKRKTFNLMSFLSTSDERDFVLSNSDSCIAYIILLVKTTNVDLSIREATLSRTFMRPPVSNKDAPLLSIKANTTVRATISDLPVIGTGESLEVIEEMYEDDEVDEEMMAIFRESLESVKVLQDDTKYENQTIMPDVVEVVGPNIEETIEPEPVIRANYIKDTRAGASVLAEFRGLAYRLLMEKGINMVDFLSANNNNPFAVEENEAFVFNTIMHFSKGFGATKFVFSLL